MTGITGTGAASPAPGTPNAPNVQTDAKTAAAVDKLRAFAAEQPAPAAGAAHIAPVPGPQPQPQPSPALRDAIHGAISTTGPTPAPSPGPAPVAGPTPALTPAAPIPGPTPGPTPAGTPGREQDLPPGTIHLPVGALPTDPKEPSDKQPAESKDDDKRKQQDPKDTKQHVDPKDPKAQDTPPPVEPRTDPKAQDVPKPAEPKTDPKVQDAPKPAEPKTDPKVQDTPKVEAPKVVPPIVDPAPAEPAAPEHTKDLDAPKVGTHVAPETTPADADPPKEPLPPTPSADRVRELMAGDAPDTPDEQKWVTHTREKMKELAPHINELVDSMGTELAAGRDGSKVADAVPAAVKAATTASYSIKPDRRTELLNGAKPASAEEEVFVGGVALVIQQMLATVNRLIATRKAELGGTAPAAGTSGGGASNAANTFVSPLALDAPGDPATGIDELPLSASVVSS